MCGINGILHFNSLNDYKPRIKAMNNALAHRGPDSEGIYSDENISLGHRRLAIIDLSDLGRQPMFCKDKRFAIIFNGEIYNFNEIKTQLKDYPFKSDTDTEVILAAYSKWGINCLNKFNGMFAFAIWDKVSRELFTARDRLGIKPLYYYKDKDYFIFSSELRAVVSSGLVSKNINLNGLTDYLRYGTVHAPDTILKSIFMLMPGHFMLISKNDFKIKKYWDITECYGKEAENKTYDEIKKDIYHLLFKSVQRRMISDVPFGAFLSGGIDSSSAVGLMSKISDSVNTFSITFNEQSFNEAKYSNLIAKKFKTRHTEILLSPADFLNLLPNALESTDHPSFDGTNTYVVSKVTKNAGITMALSGIGGDELFCGYEIFKRTILLDKYSHIARLPNFIKNYTGKSLRYLYPSVLSEKTAKLLKYDKWDILTTYSLSRQILLSDEISKILNDKALTENRVSEILNTYLKNGTAGYNLPLLSKVSFAEINTYLQNTLLRDTDQMSMAHALEVREPFLDYELIEYVFGIPDKYKYPHTPKKLLTDAMGELLPKEIINRPKKGFLFPWEQWLKNELKNFCCEKINDLSKRACFNESEVKNLWMRFLNNDPVITWSRVWHLIVLEHWLEHNKIDS